MADTITIRTSTERDVVKIVERGPQGPAGGGGGGGSGTVTSVALASSDLTITGSPITTSGTITANITANAVTLEKLQTISSEHLLGRHGSGNGGVQQVGLGTGLAMSGSNIQCTVIAPTASSATPSALGTASSGSATDYARADHIHSAEVSDSAFRVLGSTDATKKVALEVDTNVPSGQTVTLTAPSASGTLALAGAAPAAHAASHAAGQADELFNQSLNTTDSVTFQEITIGSLGTIDFSAAQNMQLAPVATKLDIKDVSSEFIGALRAQNDSLTANRNYELPDASGTLALTSDIPTAVTSVSGTAPIVSSGGTTPAISIQSSPTLTGDVVINGATTGASGTLKVGSTTGSFNSDVELNDQGVVLRNSGSSGTTTIARGTGGTLSYTITPPAKTGTIAVTSDLHNQSHAITSTSDHTAGNNKVFYSNSSGQITELALGAANTVLTSNGTTSAPSFAAVSAGATNLWIPASAWIPRTTTGCGVDSTELSTNKVNTDQLLFDTATEEYAQAMVMMPSNYNYGTITARFYWTASSGSGGVAFGLRGRAYADDDALDQAQGTGQVTTDTFIVADDLHVTAATSAITLAGTPAANRPVQFEIYRQVSNASDTLGVDARLLGVEVIFN